MDTVQIVNFDSTAPGTLPAGWTSGVTGKGAPRWSVEADPSAPSKPNVLQQSGSGTFPWCVLPKTAIEIHEQKENQQKTKRIKQRTEAFGGVGSRLGEEEVH